MAPLTTAAGIGAGSQEHAASLQNCSKKIPSGGNSDSCHSCRGKGRWGGGDKYSCQPSSGGLTKVNKTITGTSFLSQYKLMDKLREMRPSGGQQGN